MHGISDYELDLEFAPRTGQDGPFLAGRRPIFDAELNVIGYRVMANSKRVAKQGPYGPAGDRFVLDGFEVEREEVFGNDMILVSASRDFIVSGIAPELPGDNTVIEMAASPADDEELLVGCQRLVDAGYRLALAASPLLTDQHPLLVLASFVKVDVRAMTAPDLKTAVRFYKSAGAKVIAYPVNSMRDLTGFKQLGFDLYEGYLLSEPVTTQTDSLTPNRLNCLRLIEMVCDSESTPNDFEQLMGADAGLSLRILHVSGIGPAGGLRRPVRSVGEAVVLLGRDQMYSWLSLVLMADANQGPSEQLTIAMTRARMCALIAGTTKSTRPESAFTVGLLSGTSLLLGVPLSDLVRRLSITDDLIAALVNFEGPLGAILKDVLGWELGAEDLHLVTGLTLAEAEQTYLEAISWANSLVGQLGAAKQAAA